MNTRRAYANGGKKFLEVSKIDDSTIRLVIGDEGHKRRASIDLEVDEFLEAAEADTPKSLFRPAIYYGDKQWKKKS